jgi:hypothetical protein
LAAFREALAKRLSDLFAEGEDTQRLGKTCEQADRQQRRKLEIAHDF